MDQWMKQNSTDPDLRDCIYEYATGRGEVINGSDICIKNDYDDRYKITARSQDSIGMAKVYGRDGMQGDRKVHTPAAQDFAVIQ